MCLWCIYTKAVNVNKHCDTAARYIATGISQQYMLDNIAIPHLLVVRPVGIPLIVPGWAVGHTVEKVAGENRDTTFNH